VFLSTCDYFCILLYFVHGFSTTFLPKPSLTGPSRPDGLTRAYRVPSPQYYPPSGAHSPMITMELSSTMITMELSSPMITMELSSPMITMELSSHMITMELSPPMIINAFFWNTSRSSCLRLFMRKCHSFQKYVHGVERKTN